MDKSIFDNAPEWANYVAQNEDGEWYFHEKEPKMGVYQIENLRYTGEWLSTGKIQAVISIPWRKSLLKK